MKNISFIIPVYNAENTIEKTIRSILIQKCSNKIEVIAIDDKSNDKSVEIISKFKNVRLITNKKNLGLAKSLNIAIKAAKNDLICIIWCDCVLKNNRWLHDIIVHSNGKNIAAITSKLIIPEEYWKKFSFWDRIVLTKDYNDSLEGRGTLRPTVFNKKILMNIGLYNEKEFRVAGEDTDLKWRIIERGYKIVNSKTEILHLHGFYNLSLRKQLFNKALPLAEAAGVNFAKHGIKSLPNRYWNHITSTFLYLTLFVPILNKISLILIIALILFYTLNVFKFTKDFKIIYVPFFKLIKDIISIIGFWKGFITGKQNF